MTIITTIIIHDHAVQLQATQNVLIVVMNMAQESFSLDGKANVIVKPKYYE
jgi:hypothetical protein